MFHSGLALGILFTRTELLLFCNSTGKFLALLPMDLGDRHLRPCTNYRDLKCGFGLKGHGGK